MDVDVEKRRTYYLFAAGSGITPLMSTIKTVLEAEPMCAIFLLYGSRTEDQIIFRDELDQISEKYAGQLHVENHVSVGPKKGWGRLVWYFQKKQLELAGKNG